MRRACLLVILASWALPGCDGTPPGFILPDGAPRDSGITDGGDSGSPRSDAGPVLPPADRVVVLPFGEDPTVVSYEVAARPSQLDLHVSMDTTSSFAEEIDALQAALNEQILPSVRLEIPSTSVGVSSFEDFPATPFGGPADRPFTLHTAITSSTTRVDTALRELDAPLGYGGDFPESGFEALYQIATGAGYSQGGVAIIPRASGNALVGGGTEGGVGFRPGSLRAVLHITDARSHTPSDYDDVYPGTRGLGQAIAALRDERIKVIGIASGTIAREDLTSMALGTDAVMPPTNGACETGVGGATYPPIGGVCPLVFDVLSDGTGLSGTILGAITSLITAIRYGTVAFDLGDNRLGFVRHARAVSATVSGGAPAPTIADLDPVDGIAEAFVGVHVGTTLRFELTLANDLLPELDYEQIFLLRITIVADGTTLVGETIRIVIPARIPDAGVSDAGTDAIID